MLKILVTYAVQGEFAEIKWPDAEVYYVRTGIGKVKAAFHLAEAIRQVEPDIVINMGTAGTIHHKVGDIFVCRHFIDLRFPFFLLAHSTFSQYHILIPFFQLPY